MWLALDTATDRASVALGDSADSAFDERLDGARRHASALVPMIDTLLGRAGIGMDRVSGVIVADGPGSFTGLRVAAAAAKALARPRGLELWAAPSLMARAAAAGAGRRLVLAVANAFRGEVFAAAYRFPPGEVVTELAASVWHPEALAGAAPVPDLIVGDVPEAALAALGRWAGAGAYQPDEGPSARHLLDLRGRRGGAAPVPDPSQWEPTYGRPAEAQARWESAHGRPLPDPVGDPR